MKTAMLVTEVSKYAFFLVWFGMTGSRSQRKLRAQEEKLGWVNAV